MLIKFKLWGHLYLSTYFCTQNQAIKYAVSNTYKQSCKLVIIIIPVT